MKVGDLVRYKATSRGYCSALDGVMGTVVEFIPATHPKEYQKIRVLWSGKLQNWPMEYCEVVSESR